MNTPKRILGACVLLLSMVSMSCVSPATMLLQRKVAREVVSVAQIDQAMLDDAWKEALKVGGGKPDWPLPVPLVRVVYVPSTLAIGPYQYYGITITEPMLIDGELVLVETIEIHLPNNLACHIKQVLVHELLHCVATRRALTDKTFEAEVMKAGTEEAWVRTVWPIDDMGMCG